MRCSKVRFLLTAGEPAGAAAVRRAVAAHLAECASCRAEAAVWAELDAGLNAWAGDPAPPLPTDFTAAVMARVRRASQPAPRRRLDMLWSDQAWSAAVLALLGWFGLSGLVTAVGLVWYPAAVFEALRAVGGAIAAAWTLSAGVAELLWWVRNALLAPLPAPTPALAAALISLGLLAEVWLLTRWRGEGVRRVLSGLSDRLSPPA